MKKLTKKPISGATVISAQTSISTPSGGVDDGELAIVSAVGQRTAISAESITLQSPRNFYVIVTPGFEELAASEIQDWCADQFPDLKLLVGRGGIEFTLPLRAGCELNRVLKTPTRILVRLADYGCRDFPKLFKKMSSFPWHEWVSDETPIEFHATSKSSRLAIKKRIEETCLDGRKAALKKRGVGMPKSEISAVTVYVRFEDDICWVSLDTSGEILHKRGLRPLSSDAPLRETVAANLLRYLESFDAENFGAESSSSDGKIELVDPMTGGGTFLIEAALARRAILSRQFAFENFVVFAGAGKAVGEKAISKSKDPYSSFVGFESDAKVLRAAADNLNLVRESRTIKLIEADFFEAEALVPGPRRWLIANPPYGERIRVEGKLSDFYERLFLAAEAKVKPERALFILPEKVNPKGLKIPPEWSVLGEKRFLNGGLAVFAMVYGRRA